MTIGVLLTAFALGIRHGVDWDHIAAISDLCGSAETRRRGLRLSFLYAIGHAAVVLVLGAVVILFDAAIPDGLDEWMARVVGLTLIGLGGWVIVGLVRHGRDFRLRSRWMLVLDGAFAGIRRVRGRNGDGPVTLESEHEHEHEHEHGVEPHRSVALHDHAHDVADSEPKVVDPVPTVSRRSRSFASGENDSGQHTHRHRHELILPTSTSDRSGARSATGIGMLHGVGVESPTQIAVFVASTSIGGRGLGLVLLVAWVVGLVISSAMLAVLAVFGLLHAERNSTVYRLVALFVAVSSIAIGLLYLTGFAIT